MSAWTPSRRAIEAKRQWRHKFSQEELDLGSTQLDLPEWLGVPLRQIPPEYECNGTSFNRSAYPKSVLWCKNYEGARRRPGLRRVSIDEFWNQAAVDFFERMPKVRRYLTERRRRPALAATRAIGDFWCASRSCTMPLSRKISLVCRQEAK